MMIFAISRPNSVVTLALGVFLSAAAAAQAGSRIDYNREIRPILSDACYQCHGPDAKTREADLRLDTREGLFAEIDGVRPVGPGKPDASEIILRMTAEDKDEVMPPPKAKKALKAEQIALLREWIRQGAEFKGHWSFEPPVKPTVPELAPGDQSAVD